MLLLAFICTISVTSGYNLVVDVNPKAVTRYLSSFGPFYVQQLTDHEIPLIEKSRCLGRIAIASTTVSQVALERTEVVRDKGDYYLKLTHLHARLHGEYKHNVLFVHQSGDFDLRMRDLNATIGPLVPVAIAGLPFIDSSVGCRISHAEDNFDVHGGILRVVAKRRLRETLETDLEDLLCDSFIDILDRGLRSSLKLLQLTSQLSSGHFLSFALPRPPLLLESGAIRVFHEGIGPRSERTSIRFSPETLNSSDFDVVFHIHQNLLTEALSTICLQFERQVLATRVQCISVNANFSEMAKTENVVLTVVLQEDGVERTRTFNSRLLQSEKLELFVRLKSEVLVPGTQGTDYSRQLFSTLAEDLRSKFQITFPLPKNLRMDNIQAMFKPDRLILVGNLK